MSQYLTQTFGQQMRLEQRLTPQLIQSMAILQKPVTDLEAYIAEALENNAALELAEPEAPEAAAEGGDGPDGRAGRADTDAGSFARLHRLSRDYYPDYHDFAPARAYRAASGDERDPKMGAMANTAGREVSLNEHLLSQWALVEVDETTRRAGEAIINHLDPDGYLRVRLGASLEGSCPAHPWESSPQKESRECVARSNPSYP